MALSQTAVERRGTSIDLIVALHAYTQTSASLNDLREAILARPELADADVVFPSYPAGIFDNGDPLLIADEIAGLIHAEFEGRRQRLGDGYRRIILIGHSLGALLVRKAYVIGRGATEELVNTSSQSAGWVDRVDRIVLFAGTNRGWSMRSRPRHMGRWRWLAIRLALLVTTPLPVARLIRSARRGAPFVANLRVQWLRLVHGGAPPPLTVQILGNKDDVMSTEDNADVAVSQRFVFLRVAATSHLNAVSFAGAEGAGRRQAFLRALLTPPEDLASDLVLPIKPDSSVKHVVFVMHGIRDRGFWTDDMAELIRQEAQRQGTTAAICTSSYGYFPMGAFLVLNQRRRNVRWFMDQYTEYYARYPNAAFHFIGHSNGTYLLASALQTYAACVFEHVVFAGSVVRTDFPWDRFVEAKRIVRVRNLVATKDAIVGIFPGFFEFLGLGDLGSAGLNGFRDNEAKRFAVEFLRGGHGAVHPKEFASRERLYRSIADFVLTGEPVEVPELTEKGQSSFTVWASRLNWLVWAGLVAAILWIGVLVWRQSPPAVLAYAALLFLLLYSS